jgi:hypothetical protein
MSALHATTAPSATADVNVELAMDRPARNLDLELLSDVRLFDITATVGAFVGQRRVVDFVDFLGRFAMSLGAVVLARFAARFVRLRFGWSLGERRGLPFAGAALFFEQAREAFDLGAEFSDFAFEADTVEAG